MKLKLNIKIIENENIIEKKIFSKSSFKNERKFFLYSFLFLKKKEHKKKIIEKIKV